MVLVSHIYKFIYMKNRKVAGSSVESFFGRYCLDPRKTYSYEDSMSEHIDEFGIIGSRSPCRFRPVGPRPDDRWRAHKEAAAIREDLGGSMFDRYLKFCVIRNPYDKTVSDYYWLHHHWEPHLRPSFKEFVKRTGTSVDLSIHSIGGRNVCDYFIRFEHLEEDMGALCDRLGIDSLLRIRKGSRSYDLSLLPRHKSEYRQDGHKHWSEYYDEETRRIVYDRHKEEFDLFGYSPWVPHLPR